MNLKKKIITSLGIAVIAMAMFFSTANTNNLTDFDMASLMSMNTANAEDGPFDVVCKCNFYANCKVNGSQETCASFNGNGFCSNYDSNCGF